MKDEIKEILDILKTDMIHIRLFKEDREKLLDYITNLQEENKRLKELCDKYEEEHSTKFNEWVFDKRENERLNNVINELEKYFAKPNKFIERTERIKILDKLKELKEGK